MFSIDGTPVVERFELCIVRMKSSSRELSIPIVGQWLEFQMEARRLPDPGEVRYFFEQLAELIGDMRGLVPGLRWYFLHKPPGLKLRFRVGDPDEDILDKLLSRVLAWSFPWQGQLGLGSVFDQAELLSAPYRESLETLLTIAADEHLRSVREERLCREEDWAEFIVDLLCRFDLDHWLVHEALGRLVRIRSTILRKASAAPVALHDPTAMLTRPLPESPPGLGASVSLLQALNLMLNVWAVGAPAQSRILELARASVRPALLPPVE